MGKNKHRHVQPCQRGGCRKQTLSGKQHATRLMWSMRVSIYIIVEQVYSQKRRCDGSSGGARFLLDSADIILLLHRVVYHKHQKDETSTWLKDGMVRAKTKTRQKHSLVSNELRRLQKEYFSQFLWFLHSLPSTRKYIRVYELPTVYPKTFYKF